MAITLNGSTGITSPGGDTSTSLSTGLLTVTGSTVPANGMYLPTTNTLAWATNSTRNMTLDSSGNVGIGTSSPNRKLQLTVSPSTSGDDGARVTDGTRIIQSAITGSTYSYKGIGANETMLYSLGNPLNIVSDNQPIKFIAGSGEAMRLDSSGNLGLGVTPSGWGTILPLQVKNAAFAGYANNAYMIANAYFASGNFSYIASDYATRYTQAAGQHQFFTAPSGTAGNAISFTQAMTLDASGNLLVGQTSASGTSGQGVALSPTTGPINSYLSIVSPNSVTGTNILTAYSTGAAAFRFYAQWDGKLYATTTTITGISDQRLKENIRDLDDGLVTILALKPRKFDWKEGKGKDIKNDRGFIAQEFEEVLPDLIDQWKDEPPEGEEFYKAVRPDLIPILVKAIQELTARLEALEGAK